MAESMSVAMLKHMVATSKDPDFHPVLQDALNLSTRNIGLLEATFTAINHPIPDAFGEKDVDVNAPQLFDEAFSVRYTRLMNKYILINHIMAFTEASRFDLISLFSGFIDGSKQIIQKADQVLLEKGLFPKPPCIVLPDRVDYIHDKNYYGSIMSSIHKNHRALNVMEISNIFKILDFKMAMESIHLGFSQVVRSDKLRKHLNRGREMINKHIHELRTILENDGLPGPEKLEFQVTDSSESPYSDRLILLHVTAANTHILTAFGFGLARMLRKDVITTYGRLIPELMGHSKDSADIIIENGWMEKMPGTTNRQELTH